MRCLVLAAVLFVLGGVSQAQNAFPPLSELEAHLKRSPEMEAERLKVERLRREQGWANRLTIHGNYSQHWSSVVPFVISEPGVSGGISIGISASLKLARLFKRRDPARVEMELERLELRRLYLQRLAELRIFYRRRLKLLSELRAIRAEENAAILELESIRAGLRVSAQLDNETGGSPTRPGTTGSPRWPSPAKEGVASQAWALNTPIDPGDPKDLAIAEAKVAQDSSRRDQVRLDIANLETRILELVGLIR